MTLDLLTLLRAVGPDIWDAKIKLVRHRDTRFDLPLLLRSGHFWIYESGQGRDVFKGAHYILSFLGEGYSRSRFLGCKRVDGLSTALADWPSDFPYPQMGRPSFWYDLTPVSGFEALEDRLVIDWGAATRVWVQWLRSDRPREVIEILPRGHAGEFPGYDSVILPFADLVRIVEHPDANRSWHLALREIAAVYLITDTATGELYVGSASGAGGLLARWMSYARTGHAGNKLLRDVLERDPYRSEAFQFTILRPLPLSMSGKEVIAVESTFKRKLGSRAHGLNAN